MSTLEQPAQKKRRLSKEEYKRVLIEKKEAKKRERAEAGEDTAKTENNKYYQIFNTTKKKKIEKNEDKMTDREEEEVPLDKKWTKEEWDEKLRRRQARIDKEEIERLEKIEKAKRMEKGWDLIKLCKKMMQEEGFNWKISQERREQMRKEEIERTERKGRAAVKKTETLEKIENKNLQRKITDTLGKLPRNRRILLEREIEKERRITIKEAREELWKRWRHSKGKKKKTQN